MKKLKHNKIKNTGLLFEILTRMVMHETLDPGQNQTSIKLIKSHFNPNSELLKELRLYQTLSSRSDNDSKELLKLSLESHRCLDKKRLLEEKYNLIKSIKKNYNIDVFFDTRVSNYPLTAAIYKLFEFEGKDNPEDYLTNKKFIFEHLTGKKEEPIEEEAVVMFREQDPDVRKLGFKIIIEKFNDKYRSLNPRQRKLLSNYINNDTNKDDFKNYILKEVSFIAKSLTNKAKTISDEITKIKLNETINLTQNIISAKTIKEDHLSSMLKYYELIDILESQ